MKILLDIDDTALITNDKGKTWKKHPLLEKLISEHRVFLYSGNPEIDNYSKEWKTAGFIPKGSDTFPKADVLIDNDAELWKDSVEVNEIFDSIDSFYKDYEKQ